MLIPLSIAVSGPVTSIITYFGGTLSGVDAVLPTIAAIVAALLLVSWWVVDYATLLDSEPDRDRWFQDAVFFLVRRRWPERGEKLLPPLSDGESVLDWRNRVRELPDFRAAEAALLRMRQAARDGRNHLQVWGRIPATHAMTDAYEVNEAILFTPLEPTHWESHIVDPLQLILRPEQLHTLTTEWSMMDDECACSLMVSKTQVEILRKEALVPCPAANI